MLPVLLAGGLAVVGAASPAAAAKTSLVDTVARPVTWAAIDRHAPRSVAIDGPADAAIGAWRDGDGERHTSRAYFTFDLTGRAAGVISGATLELEQTEARNCRFVPEFEVLRTDEVTPASSWRRPPAELQEHSQDRTSDDTPCPATRHRIDVREAVQGAVYDGKSVITFAVRLPAGVEGEQRRFVRIANNPELSISAPDVGLPVIDGVAEGIDLPHQITLRPGRPGVVRYLWKLMNTEDDEAEQHSVLAAADGTAVITVTLTEPGLYYFSVTSLNASGEAREASTYFQATSVPDVTSNYLTGGPGGGVGVAAPFQFRPRNPDVVAYRYRFNNEDEQRVDAVAGGAATVTWAPSWPGYNMLTLAAINSAGKESEEGTYHFRVEGPTPEVSSVTYPASGVNGGRGVAGEFFFRPGVDSVAFYRYSLNGGAEKSIEADQDGRAWPTITPDRLGRNELEVRSVTFDGAVSEPTTFVFLVANRPFVTAGIYNFDQMPAGRPGLTDTFTITTDRTDIPEVERFEWFVDGLGQSVDAEADGTAQFQYTPTRPGLFDVRVVAVAPDGTRYDPFVGQIAVNNPAPVLWSDVYSEWEPAGGVGQPGVFWADSAVTGYSEAVWRLNDGPAVPHAAGESVTLTPDRVGENAVTVELRWPDGRTATTTWTFLVAG